MHRRSPVRNRVEPVFFHSFGFLSRYGVNLTSLIMANISLWEAFCAYNIIAIRCSRPPFKCNSMDLCRHVLYVHLSWSRGFPLTFDPAGLLRPCVCFMPLSFIHEPWHGPGPGPMRPLSPWMNKLHAYALIYCVSPHLVLSLSIFARPLTTFSDRALRLLYDLTYESTKRKPRVQFIITRTIFAETMETV